MGTRLMEIGRKNLWGNEKSSCLSFLLVVFFLPDGRRKQRHEAPEAKVTLERKVREAQRKQKGFASPLSSAPRTEITAEEADRLTT